jgi:hypothetical protein
MIPLTLALSLQGEGIIAGSSPLRGEGWERVKYQYYYETVNNCPAMTTPVAVTATLLVSKILTETLVFGKYKVVIFLLR